MADAEVTPAGEDSQYPSTEVWKPVPSEPGVLASSWGRILLPPRYAPLPRGGYRAYMPEPRYGQVSKAKKEAAHEFRLIMVRREEAAARQAPRKVHQLVCEAFHGPKPFREAVVLHLDEDAHNNRPENLRWGTQKENLNAPRYLEWRRSVRGDAHPNVKWTDEQVADFRRRAASGEKRRAIMEYTGISSGSLSEILNGRRRDRPANKVRR